MDPDRPPEQHEEQLPHGIGALEITLTTIILILLAGYGAYHYFLRTPEPQPVPEILPSLEQFFRQFPPARFAGDGARICVVVPTATGDESYAVRKEAGIITTRRAGAPGCDGIAGEDFILRYISRAGFDAHIANPGCAPFLNGGRGNPYWYLPSKLWVSGKDRPECNADFQERYCSAVAACIDPAGVPFGMFSCCADDKLTAAQRERVAAARGAA